MIHRLRAKLNAGDGVGILICYLKSMERGGKMIVSLLSVLALGVGIRSSAASSDGPYRAIVDRNVFDLRPMPVAAINTAPATPPPNVKLGGLMEITGHPQAVLVVTDPTAPSKPPVSYVLGEGERKSTVEVKSINMDNKTARVVIAGNEVQLKLEEVKATGGPAPGGAPGLAGAPGPRQFPPGVRGAGRGAFPMPTPGSPAMPASPSYQPTAAPDASALPTRPVRTDATDAAAQPAMTPEQQFVQIEQNRDAYTQNNDPRAQILPPTPLTQALQASAAGGGQDTGASAPQAPAAPQRPLGMRTTGSMVAPPLPP
jgi:hypothetical protein